MRYREPFTIFPRPRKNGETVYYYRIYDEDGKRTTVKSTGQTYPLLEVLLEEVGLTGYAVKQLTKYNSFCYLFLQRSVMSHNN